ncbi:MAG: TonB C-terminal domain-containing protein, partial [bacterium]
AEISKKPLSGQVGKILTLLTPVTLQNFPEKKSLNLNPVELKGYHQQLKGFLSERWEVPIHLIESQFTAVIQLEITKNGRLLSWSMEESENSALNKTVKKLLKNLRFLPSLPESYPEDSYKFGVRFTPANFQL